MTGHAPGKVTMAKQIDIANVAPSKAWSLVNPVGELWVQAYPTRREAEDAAGGRGHTPVQVLLTPILPAPRKPARKRKPRRSK